MDRRTHNHGQEHEHEQEAECHCQGHAHAHDNDGVCPCCTVGTLEMTPEQLANKFSWRENWPWLAAMAMVLTMNAVTVLGKVEVAESLQFAYYLVAYALASAAVWKNIGLRLREGEIFNEFSLMALATLGAFYLREYSEGVSVMIFYRIGESFQERAINRAKRSIRALLAERPNFVTVLRNGGALDVRTETVGIGETIQVRPGEKVGLDGVLLSAKALFNTAVLTGESRPQLKLKDDEVLAGMINQRQSAEIKATAAFENTVLAKMLDLVHSAAERKSRVQLFITRFARIYTPAVAGIALLVTLVPWFFVENYDFDTWFYKGLGFLVISCPCALVVSIPLGYFGGIGLASKYGILFKGANYLDEVTRVDTVVLDKTGTLTSGAFAVQRVDPAPGIAAAELVANCVAMERLSLHPVAQALVQYAPEAGRELSAENFSEEPGRGVEAWIRKRRWLLGSARFLRESGVAEVPENGSVFAACDGVYMGSFTILDALKPEAPGAVAALKKAGLRTIMLSGDKASIVAAMAQASGVDEAYGDMLPQDKVAFIEQLERNGHRVAFVGDGVNDAPALATASVGLAMGALGSDAAVDVADVVIQNDAPERIMTAIVAGVRTRRIVWQNIVLAMGVKLLVMVLLFCGMSELWEAVFADVGVALLAIMNAMRLQRMAI